MKKLKRFSVPRRRLRPYWKDFCRIYDNFFQQVKVLEEDMSKDLGIEGMEFIHTDMGWCGIGTADRKMRLEQFDPE